MQYSATPHRVLCRGGLGTQLAHVGHPAGPDRGVSADAARVIECFADGEFNGARSLAPRALVTLPMHEQAFDHDAHMCRAPMRKPRHALRLKGLQYATREAAWGPVRPFPR